MAIFQKKTQKQPLQQHEADGDWNEVMDSQSDRKTRKSPDAQRKVRVTEDELGHQLLPDTIRTIKLSLMNTGIFFMSEAQRRLMKLRAAVSDDASNDLDEWSPDDSESDGSGESTGVDPYNSGSLDSSKGWKSRSRK